MQLDRADPIDQRGLRRLARSAGASASRHVRLRSLVVIVERHGHPRMASWGAADVSRLTLGMAESRAFQALILGESEARDPHVLPVPFPHERSSLRGLVRFECVDPIPDHTRTLLGIEALRLAMTIEAADALSLGDYALRSDQPAAALVSEDGTLLAANRLFDALYPGAELIDELGTTMRERDALRRLLDESFVTNGLSRTANLRVGPAARSVVARVASPAPGVSSITIVDAALSLRAFFLEPSRTPTRLPSATLDRTTLAVIDGNDEGLRLFAGLVARVAPSDRFAFLASTLDVEGDPTWLSPFSLLEGGSLEIVAVASERGRVPTLVVLASHASTKLWM